VAQPIAVSTTIPPTTSPAVFQNPLLGLPALKESTDSFARPIRQLSHSGGSTKGTPLMESSDSLTA
jgi:hypothetical protein